MERAKRHGVMLAYPGDEGRIRRLGDRIFAQPKYKGLRCRVDWFRGEPVLLSSYGHEFKYLEHIKDSLKQFSDSMIPFDGELYVHGWSQERLNSATKRKVNKNPDSEHLQFHIFDIQWEEKSQWFRTHQLNEFKENKFFDGTPLKVVPTSVIYQEDWLPLMNEYVQEGYEGIILRNPIALYAAKRSVGLIKVKPTEEDEYKIIDVLEAISLEGNPKGMVGAFSVQDNEGIVFSVGAGKLKHKERERLWKGRGDLIGKMLVTKHEPDKTKGGVPVCAVAVRVKL